MSDLRGAVYSLCVYKPYVVRDQCEFNFAGGGGNAGVCLCVWYISVMYHTAYY